MKKSFVNLFAVAMILTSFPACVRAADYYVVVGSFIEEANARKFVGQVRPAFQQATYSFNERRKLYYVHVVQTSRKEEARKWALYLRQEKRFTDAWVLSYPDVDEMQVTRQAENHVSGTQKESFSESRLPRYVSATMRVPDNTGILSPGELEASSARSAPVASGTGRSISWVLSGDLQFATGVSPVQAQSGKGAMGNSEMFTFVVEGADGRPLQSEVMLVDFEKVKKLTGIRFGEHLAIKPTKRNQVVTFVCEMIGYSMETRMFNIDHLSRGRDIHLREDGVWEVRFKLRKLKVDEVSFLNKTAFYPDAAVLEPSSEIELNDLLVMMKSNTAYEIVVHSHCNPGGRRAVLVPADKRYFEKKDAVTKSASDRRLTKHRAETVRNYLVDHGIDKERIGIVGWGSADLLVAADAVDAYINDRIEIELVAD